MKVVKLFLIGFIIGIPLKNFGQDISLHQQFNGRYDYLAIGNTLNPFENNLVGSFCEILPSSQADLNLNTGDTIVAAYLYWAGSGEGDTNISLNGNSINSDLLFNVTYTENALGPLVYFSCFADVTDLVLSEGNATYTLSDLDISDVLANDFRYCDNRTNFAGWAMYVIYQNDDLPLNQINLFQGLEIINRNVQEKTIVLENLNVIDNEDAKIGFLAWEGDNALNYGETLSINGNILANPPLNLANNAFNGTNTFTNSNTFYNMDLDVYDIQDNIQIGDSEATIRMTTGGLDANGVFQADLIIINNIITVLNSQLPDATIALDDYDLNCDDELLLNYTVFNINSTDILPASTPIAFYINGIVVGQSNTENEIPIGDSESGSIILTIPDGLVDSFELTISVDDDGSHNGMVTETSEVNNTFTVTIELLQLPTVTTLPNVLKCNEGYDSAVFNLIDAIPEEIDISTIIGFYESIEDLTATENEIFLPEAYASINNPQTIYVKVETIPCFDILQFDIMVENCPPYVPDGFSPNNDSKNDWFNIQGLYNIFLDHELVIFNRYGTLIFEGNNDTPWNGKANRGLNNLGKLLPQGTYFFILNLNDPNYKPIQGWVYMNY
ncbi:gliding motility-associated C-terminal domain-containing protein [Subsaxibacter sp. CAU 1640]|uniref:gliding motility-associated C-terminal domain-containing protein n=1 Tax=Subsaxibacter sp. CAU 1640 TaxID=2933271 RepID=UPI002004443E|nr:gliding motility-associated C-terminal domain-containing protein [Subsaxibacter sp. CAU 1640]MCK7591573.1 gliding motility-associated C-terminal domain-containing protein [Subsaxibacter sp. CAU 1640]